MEERDLIPEIDPTLGLTDEQVQSRTPAGKPVYSGKSEKEIVLTHCFTFFNLIFVILAVMLVVGGSSPLNMGFLVVAVNQYGHRHHSGDPRQAGGGAADAGGGTPRRRHPQRCAAGDFPGSHRQGRYRRICLRRHPPRRRHLTQRGNVGGRVAAHRRGRRGDEGSRG